MAHDPFTRWVHVSARWGLRPRPPVVTLAPGRHTETLNAAGDAEGLRWLLPISERFCALFVAETKNCGNHQALVHGERSDKAGAKTSETSIVTNDLPANTLLLPLLVTRQPAAPVLHARKHVKLSIVDNVSESEVRHHETNKQVSVLGRKLPHWAGLKIGSGEGRRSRVLSVSTPDFVMHCCEHGTRPPMFTARETNSEVAEPHRVNSYNVG